MLFTQMCLLTTAALGFSYSHRHTRVTRHTYAPASLLTIAFTCIPTRRAALGLHRLYGFVDQPGIDRKVILLF